jgi:hypothetical protein
LGGRIASIARLALCVDSYDEYKPGLLRAGLPAGSVVDTGSSPAGAIHFLRDNLRSGDVVLIKGRVRQKLARIGLALEGREVNCTLPACQFRSADCDVCSLLERGATVSRRRTT